ncbi:MAG: polymer-forming cytoskeletal protein [Candidatus Peregrinibacteria bacterium]|nr:polymer-forming cytoskeletal protein [Candidatus Peregrinibacteria bacterium]
MIVRSLFVALLLVAPALPVSEAATFLHGKQVSISAPVNDDLYAAGGMLRISEPVNGDLVIAGGNITVSQSVAGDLIAAGGNISVRGTIGDDARVAGGDVTIASTLSGDLIVFGGSVVIEENTTVEGDLVVFGGHVTVLGIVRGDLQSRTGYITLNGEVLGSADMQGERVVVAGRIAGPSTLVAEKIELQEGASFGGNVTYWQENGELEFGSSLQGGTATFDPELQPHRNVGKRDAMKAFGLLALWSFLSGLLLLLILVLATKNFFRNAAKEVEDRPLQMMLWGFLYLIAVPVLAVLLCFSLIGIPLGLFVLMMYAFVLYFSCVFTALVFGKWLQEHYKLSKSKLVHFGVSLGVYIAMALLTLIPILGWLVQLLLVCTALGALLATKLAVYRKVM